MTDNIRRARFAELVGDEEYNHGDEITDPDRFLLVESNDRSGERWVSTFATADDAADYHVNQEYAGDWLAEILADLDTGDEYRIESRPRAVLARSKSAVRGRDLVAGDRFILRAGRVVTATNIRPAGDATIVTYHDDDDEIAAVRFGYHEAVQLP